MHHHAFIQMVAVAIAGQLAAVSGYAAPDLSTPEKACQSMLAALRADDAAEYRACFAPSDPRYAALLDATLTRKLSEHRLVQAVSTRFGHGEAFRAVDWAVGDNEEIVRMLASLQLKPRQLAAGATKIDIQVSSFIYDLHLLDSRWKIALSYLGNYDDPELFLRKTVAETRRMDDITAQLRAGQYANVEEARSGLGLLAMAEAADAQPPAERWAKRAAEPGLSALQKGVYGQIGLLSQSQLLHLMVPGSYFVDAPAKGTPDAAGRLSRMGIDAVPFLAEALDDATMTQTIRDSRRFVGNPMPDVPVNELAARIIVMICGRTFTVPRGDAQADIRHGSIGDLAPQYQKAIAAWYAANRDRTYVQRRIADLEDASHNNRLDSLNYFYGSPSAAAFPAMSRNAVRVLKELRTSRDSLRATELSETLKGLAISGRAADAGARARTAGELEAALREWTAEQPPNLGELQDTLRALKEDPPK